MDIHVRRQCLNALSAEHGHCTCVDVWWMGGGQFVRARTCVDVCLHLCVYVLKEFVSASTC